MSKIVILLLATSFIFLITKPESIRADCNPSGYLLVSSTSKCNSENDSECCQAGNTYPTYECSPDVSDQTPATMTLNGFAQGEDGGGPSECDNQYHSDSEKVVALSTGWYKGRCNQNIRITASNGKFVVAKVVDQCDSTVGCDKDHNYGPPCANNIVDASIEVWNELGFSGDNVGEAQITWSDARVFYC